MKILRLLLYPLLFVHCTAKGDGKPDDSGKYTNPVSEASLPDPTIVETPDGWFYLYATENIVNVPIHKSRNLVDWEFVGTAFSDATRPNFEPEGGIWAPDINYVNGKYLLYYSMSVWGGEETCGVGVAIADKPEGPFADRGKLFRSNEIGVTNSIDPFYIEDEGRKYLFWGSFRGIYAVELSNDGLSVEPEAEKIHVGGTAFEGTCIHKQNGYYYFFASVGSCCEGLKSTYKLVVARSRSLFGPYVDKSGKSILDDGYETVIDKSEVFTGNGHCSEIVRDKNGADWIFYHGIRNEKPTGRRLMMDRIRWTDDWPYVEGGIPSESADKPEF